MGVVPALPPQGCPRNVASPSGSPPQRLGGSQERESFLLRANLVARVGLQWDACDVVPSQLPILIQLPDHAPVARQVMAQALSPAMQHTGSPEGISWLLALADPALAVEVIRRLNQQTKRWKILSLLSPADSAFQVRRTTQAFKRTCNLSFLGGLL